MLEKLHFIVALFAALAITILSLYQDVSFYELSKRLVVIIPLFFIFGLIIRSYLKKLFEPEKVEEITEDEKNPAEEGLEETGGEPEEYDNEDGL